MVSSRPPADRGMLLLEPDSDAVRFPAESTLQESRFHNTFQSKFEHDVSFWSHKNHKQWCEP